MGKISYKIGDFPITERFHETLLKLPVWHRNSDEEIVDTYIQAFRKVVENYAELQDK